MKLKTLLALILAFPLVSCGGGSPDIEPEPTGKEFTGVNFESLTIQYDGNSHILGDVTGAPEGTDITYTGREAHIDVGSYVATATLSKEEYITKTLNATLTITPIDFVGLSYDSASVKYDGKEHIGDVQLVGVLPADTTVTEKVFDSKGNVVTSAINVGTYSYTAIIENKNYNTLTLTANLSIRTEKTDMAVFASNDGTIYFSNGLDDKHLYSIDVDNKINRIDYSSPKSFNKYSSSKALFVSTSALTDTVKEVSTGQVTSLYSSGNIDDFVKKSDDIYFYASNGLTSSKSGIFMVDKTNSTDEPIVTKVFEGKTKNLSIYNNNLYFSNGNDDYHLYKLNLTNYEASLVLDEKVHEFTIANNVLYCTVDAINDYIGAINLSSGQPSVSKLTNASGEFLVIKNNKLYFNYTDLFGVIDYTKYGIWSIDLSSKDEKHIIQTDNVNGFDVDNNGNIVFINTNDLHLYKYSQTNKQLTDLLAGFVAPEVTPLNLGGKTLSYGNDIYYLNMHAGKTLYAYNEVSKRNTQITTDKVQDFFIYNDKLYFNQVTLLTNNDIYCADLKLGSKAEKINTNDVRNMTTDGTYIYGTHYNFAGIAGGLARFKLDGSEYVKFSEVNGAKNLTIKDGELYFINADISNGYIEYYNLADITPESEDLESTRLSKNIKNVDQFIFDGDNIFYIYSGTIEHSIRRTDFTSLGEGDVIVSSSCHPYEMILDGDDIYYYSCPATSLNKSGLYKVDKSATDVKSPTVVLAADNKYSCSALCISSNSLYFLNYTLKASITGDAHFYQINLTNNSVSKIN